LRTPKADRLVIPFAALRRDKQGQIAFVVAKGKAVVKRVRTGLRLEQLIEILEGLSAGDKVVVRGFLDLRAGKKVSVVNGRASPKAKATPEAKEGS
jgi:multidrug efflux pump subunit AcrA (membrane-fusion protein)